ncbi:hypothetical protein CupriaWKF_30470 [Cupriavidus sp. WKF15]|uniref:hypothetical protein n=1 Tax=Cupriavidus sp. WKF15 TaxID=3032282 RepID=UPI0023E13B90|nr:hypothetical protein [Cupriavidus sp. WKF15]WER50689.1 hypothetical protein CupriaWKF_30470 [Cupriavidus sp. WKF15]
MTGRKQPVAKGSSWVGCFLSKTIHPLVRTPKAEKDAADDIAQAGVCKSTKAEMTAKYKGLMKAREYWPAVLTVRRCAQLTNDKDLTTMVADAEINSYVSDIENPKTRKDDRMRSIEALSRDYPEFGKKYASLLRQLKGY